MTEIKIKSGVNFRLPAYDIPLDQCLISQNYDMTHDELLTQIKGSVKYHGAILGTNAPDWVGVNYNENEDKQDILTAVDGNILKKNLGANEFSTIYSGITPGSIKNALSLNNKTYMASIKDGLFEYDGSAVVAKVNDILLSDIIVSKETNRCFGIDNSYAVVFTDDLADMGGVPLIWEPLNVDKLPASEGDVPEKLWILNGRLVIFKTNSIWIFYILGGVTDWRPQRISFPGGCIAPQTVRQVGQELWFLGFSGSTGRGVYAFNGISVRLLSYDVEPFLDRINPTKIHDACSEFVDNRYKLSVAIDASPENNLTLHIDSINMNKETGAPNIYGPHTYGFSCSTVLNTRRFQGEHLFGAKHTDGARLFKVAEYRTQHSDELLDNGDLIPTVLITGIRCREETKNGTLDQTWIKRYNDLHVLYPPTGSWVGTLEIFKDYESGSTITLGQYMEENDFSLEALNVDSDPIDFESLVVESKIVNIRAQSIQFKISNYNVAVKTAFRSIIYSADPYRQHKPVQLLRI